MSAPLANHRPASRTGSLRLALVGCGAIGLELLRLLERERGVSVEAVVVRPERVEQSRELLRPLQMADKVCSRLPAGIELLMEAGGHSAIAQHVLPALRDGVDCILASAGALASPELLEQLLQAARSGRAQVQVIPGAVGGIDALSAARLCGVDHVVYTGSKPPPAWRGTPAENTVDLDRLAQPAVVFDGTARDAARLYPKNANVTATIALAGIGFDATRVRLVADPSVAQNIHRLQARGAFGELDLRMANFPLPSNPKTSALTVYSALRSVSNVVSTLRI
jgi:aspartate dehydrogenase